MCHVKPARGVIQKCGKKVLVKRQMALVNDYPGQTNGGYSSTDNHDIIVFISCRERYASL